MLHPTADHARTDRNLPAPVPLLDGDGNHYYYGRSKTGDHDAAFAPLDWAKDDSGCTTVEYLDRYGEWTPL